LVTLAGRVADGVKVAKKNVTLAFSKLQGFHGLKLVEDQHLARRLHVNNAGVAELWKVCNVNGRCNGKERHCVNLTVYGINHPADETRADAHAAKEGNILRRQARTTTDRNAMHDNSRKYVDKNQYRRSRETSSTCGVCGNMSRPRISSRR